MNILITYQCTELVPAVGSFPPANVLSLVDFIVTGEFIVACRNLALAIQRGEKVGKEMLVVQIPPLKLKLHL